MPSVRRFRTEWLSGGLHLLIIFFAAQADDASVWPFAFAAMCAVSFFAWIGNFRRYRQVEDIPTSKIASAAQGYVELLGRSVPITDAPVIAPLSQLRCCWYRYCVETKDNEGKWTQSESGESIEHFLLVDDTGQCVVSPDGAEVLYPRRSTWEQNNCRYTEYVLVPNAELYAIGEFSTVGGANLELEESRDVSQRLGEWKQDAKALMERFDTNRDGTLDLQEWERARQAARDEVQKEHAELRSSGDVNLLRKPQDGRLFLLAAAPPGKIGKRYALWAWLHLAIVFGAGSASFLMFKWR
jgi:hypothetical protein